MKRLFVSMAAAAVKTSRIRLGMGTAVPSTRIAPTMAAGLATLNQLAPGRIDCGLGTGNTRMVGFEKIRQRGSHVVVRTGSRGCVIPMHSELKTGTLAGLLRQADVTPEEFIGSP